MLDVKGLAKLLSVSEKTVYRWISKKEVPVYKVGDSYRFNHAEIIEWTTKKKIMVSGNIYDDVSTPMPSTPDPAECLMKGGIYYHVSGKNPKAVLSSTSAVLNLPEDVDRSFIADSLFARETLGTTAIGHGIAIPHVRNPIIFDLKMPLIGLCFLEEAIDFSAPDGKPVDRIFTILTSNLREHLYLLSQLTYILSIPEIRDGISPLKSRQEILEIIGNAAPVKETPNA